MSRGASRRPDAERLGKLRPASLQRTERRTRTTQRRIHRAAGPRTCRRTDTAANCAITAGTTRLHPVGDSPSGCTDSTSPCDAVANTACRVLTSIRNRAARPSSGSAGTTAGSNPVGVPLNRQRRQMPVQVGESRDRARRRRAPRHHIAHLGGSDGSRAGHAPAQKTKKTACHQAVSRWS